MNRENVRKKSFWEAPKAIHAGLLLALGISVDNGMSCSLGSDFLSSGGKNMITIPSIRSLPERNEHLGPSDSVFLRDAYIRTHFPTGKVT